jgi:glycosyltransferase involved in cell wall biosynthesis
MVSDKSVAQVYPKITLVTCSYNQGQFLEDTIQSVLNQRYPNLEYMVIDGGSKDNSVEIIRRYERQLAYWISEPDSGQSDALCKGFDRGTGEIFGWLCSDDLLEPGALLEVGRLFADNPEMDVVFGDTTFIDAKSNVTRRYKVFPFHRWLLLNTANYIPQPSTFWRAKLYRQVGGLDRSRHVCMDPEMFLRFSEVTRLHHVRKYWSRMRLYPEVKSIRLRKDGLVEHRKWEKRYLGDRSELRRLVSRSTAKLMRIGYKACLGCYWP